MKNNTTTVTTTALSSLFTLQSAVQDGVGLLQFLTYLTTVLLLATSLLFYLLQSRSGLGIRKSKKQGLPPGPAPWPVVGNLPELFCKKPTFRWILGLMKEMNTDIACIRVGNVHIIPVTCPEIGREFLKKQDAVFADRPITMGTDYSSRGFLSIVVAPWGDQWKKMRRVVASEVINTRRLWWLLEKRTEEADNLVRYVYNKCKNGAGAVDVRVAARQYSGNVIRKMMFNRRHFGKGRPDGGPGVEEEEHVAALFTVLSLLYAFNVSDYVPSLRSLDLDGHEKVVKEAIKVVNKYHDPIIDERIKEYYSRCGMRKEPEDLLDVLISVKDTNGEPLLTTEEIKAQTADFIYATVDNPSNAIEWALAEMLNQPVVLNRAVEELDRVVGKDRLVQESDIPRLNYVKACAREAFRLHPIAPFNLPHVAISDTTVAGYSIPKGSHVLLSRIGLGRNPKVWADPVRFDPERHLQENPNGVVDLLEPELRFITFSTGRRGCMGSALGSAMTVMLLARLLQGFKWTIPPGKSAIDLTESRHDLFLDEPLRALAEPRLLAHVYPAH